jgi:hypothetical protein
MRTTPMTRMIPGVGGWSSSSRGPSGRVEREAGRQDGAGAGVGWWRRQPRQAAAGTSARGPPRARRDAAPREGARRRRRPQRAARTRTCLPLDSAAAGLRPRAAASGHGAPGDVLRAKNVACVLGFSTRTTPRAGAADGDANDGRRRQRQTGHRVQAARAPDSPSGWCCGSLRGWGGPRGPGCAGSRSRAVAKSFGSGEGQEKRNVEGPKLRLWEFAISFGGRQSYCVLCGRGKGRGGAR